ncbi:MAG: tRNA 2-thiocytidine(32) synthetase TtcA [Alphaproteobacteria bacterium]|nr:tRNA 2-thiocytidine(32) synthetase TtcA [Alphaproteobacteria bacterium]
MQLHEDGTPQEGAEQEATQQDGAADAERKRLEHRLLRRVAQASQEFGLIEPGDRIMACMSGGKDSYVMVHLLQQIQRRVPFSFEIVCVNLDQGHPGYPGHLLEEWLQAQGLEHRMLAHDTYSIVKEKLPEGATYCSLCSRLRRGILYNAAVELGCNKLALGHHKDDIIETLMLNLLYAGQLKAMPPKLVSDDGRNTIIRPLAFCDEAEVARLSELVSFPIIPCDLCGSQEHLQRKKVKALLAGLHADNDKVKGNIFAALGNVRPSHLLDKDMRVAAGLDPLSGAPTSETGEAAGGTGGFMDELESALR